jgi:hypothetical protein
MREFAFLAHHMFNPVMQYNQNLGIVVLDTAHVYDCENAYAYCDGQGYEK